MSTINELGKKLNKGLIKSGMVGLSKSVEIPFTLTSSTNADLFIKNYFKTAKTVFLDAEYRIISWDKWLEIDDLIYDLTKQQYVKEFSDCDDRSYITKYFTLRIFGIPQFIVHGHCYDLNGKWLFGHFWNARISDGKLYFYEPIGNIWTEVKKGQKVIMKNREYRPLTFEF